MVAKGYGIDGKSISEREDLIPALNEMMSNKGAFLLEVMVTKENNVFPMVPGGKGISEMILAEDL